MQQPGGLLLTSAHTGDSIMFSNPSSDPSGQRLPVNIVLIPAVWIRVSPGAAVPLILFLQDYSVSSFYKLLTFYNLPSADTDAESYPKTIL